MLIIALHQCHDQHDFLNGQEWHSQDLKFTSDNGHGGILYKLTTEECISHKRFSLKAQRKIKTVNNSNCCTKMGVTTPRKLNSVNKEVITEELR